MSKSGSIRLHPEHGVNPTMPVCAWCGEPTGEIVLLGAAYKGRAPMHMQLNDEPCAKCREGMAQGITFIEHVSEGSAKRTGRWCVVTEEAVRRIVTDADKLAEVLKKRACNVTPETSAYLGLFEEGSK